MSKQPDTRDELDRMLQRASKRVRFGDLVPEPAADQTAAEQEAADEQLLLLIEGELPKQQRAAVEARLAASSYDSSRHSVLAEVLDELEPTDPHRARLSPDSEQPSSFARLVFEVEQTAHRAIRWVRGTDMPVELSAAAMATRGGSTPDAAAEHFCRFERRFGDWDAVVEVERVPQREMALRVQLSQEGAPLQGGRAQLRRGEKLLESIRIKDGTVSFADLPLACYVVEIEQGEEQIAHLALDFLT